ncbi:hypothetical protein OF83DRAFT_1172080 [Amylostereum chailletii]|nr:hypothetical protein OF83DRAFT_1172080 [Amylostereum chailletii]
MIPRLPNELLLEVCGQVTSQHDLFSLRSANRTLHAIASPRAKFHTLHVTDTRTSAAGPVHLAKSPNIARFVKEISFQEKSFFDSSEIYKQAGFSSLKTAYTSLGLIPNLKHLTFDFRTDFAEQVPWTMIGLGEFVASQWLLLQWMLLEAVTGNTFPHPSLRSLKINSLLPFTHNLYYEPEFEALVASVQHLDISALHGAETFIEEELEYFIDHQFAFWDTFSTYILRPATALRTFAHLTSLTLCTVLFMDTVPGGREGIEDCIVRHKSTLLTLKLRTCSMEVPDELEEEQDSVTPRLWADVWKRFAKELGALRGFEVMFDVNNYLTYLGENEEPGDIKHAPGWELDNPALAALQDAVTARRKRFEI